MSVQEFRLGLKEVRRQFPDAPIYGVGLSSGASPLLRYIDA